MSTDYFTPYQDGVTEFKAAHMNAPLEEMDAAIGGLETDKADADHDHDDTYFTETELSTSGGGGSVHWDNITNKPTIGTGDGDVAGPASSTDNAIARFDGETGKAVQNSSVTVSDDGTVNIPSGQTYNINGSAHSHTVTLDGGLGMAFEAAAKPGAGAIYHFMMPYAMTVPANCSGSGFYNAANPSAEVVVSVKKNGTEFATCTVSTGGSPTWASSETSLSAGDRVTFAFPASQDSTWAGVAITVKGSRSV